MEILVLGDGSYVFAVLNAIAGVTSYGKLAAIGMLLGLLGWAVKGIMAPGGPKADVGWILISVVIYWILFVPRVQVMVSEVMPQPGGILPRTFVVDNVPFGLAAAGYTVSNIGVKLTQQYETSFGSAGDEARGTTGGLGRNLMLLAKLRDMMNDPTFAEPTAVGGTSFLGKYRANLRGYLMECTYPLINSGLISSDSILTAPGISGAVNDVTGNPVALMLWTATGGGQETITCADARARIEADTSNPQLVTAFDAAMKARGDQATSREIQGAFGVYANEAATEMHTLIATSMLNAVAAEASVRGPLGASEVQGVIMVEEAAHRRATQWAGEESLFVRILRPIIGFFEGLFYALAPIMALVVTMGPFGWSMVTKYMMLTIWVALWFPMLSITQLYSSIQMTQFFERMTDVDSFSPMQLRLISNEAMETLGAASALTAATPALAMSILYGGAVSMSYLAGRLQGSDMIDESKMAPKASDVGAATALQSATTGSLGGGTTFSGGGQASVAASDVRSSAQSLAQQAVEQKSVAFSEGMKQMVARNAGQNVTAHDIASTNWTNSQSEQLDRVVDQAYKEGAVSKAQYDAYAGMDQDQKMQIAWNAGLGIKVAGTGLEANGGSSATSQSSEGERRAASAAQDVAASLSQSKSARTGATAVVANQVGQSVDQGYTYGLSATEASELGHSASEMSQMSTVAAQVDSSTQAIGRQENLKYSDMGQRFMQANGDGARAELGRLEAAVRGAGLGAELDDRLAAHARSGELATKEHQRVGALVDVLSEAGGRGEAAGQLAPAYNDLLRSTFNTGYAQASGSVGAGAAGVAEMTDRVVSDTAAVDGLRARAGEVSGAGAEASSVFAGAQGGVAGIAATAGHADVASPTDGDLQVTDAMRGNAEEGGAAVTRIGDAGRENVLHQGAALIGDNARALTGGHPIAEPTRPDVSFDILKDSRAAAPDPQ